jgi:hypothetical protein
MGFATSPFTLDPVRSNEFKEAQITKEIYSLQSNILQIQNDIKNIKRQKEERESKESAQSAARKFVLLQSEEESSDIDHRQVRRDTKTPGPNV